MNDKLVKLMAAMDATGHVQVEQDVFLELAGDYLSEVAKKAEPVLAITEGDVNAENKRMFAVTCSVSMPQELQMAAAMFGLTGQLATFASLVMHVMLGYLIDEGYLSIVRVPEITQHEDGWQINPDGSSNLRTPTIGGDLSEDGPDELE